MKTFQGEKGILAVQVGADGNLEERGSQGDSEIPCIFFIPQW